MDKKIKKYTYKPEYGDKVTVIPHFTHYTTNNTMALELLCPNPSGLYCDSYAIVTVNLPDSTKLQPNQQFVDENNNPGIGQWLMDNGIAKPIDVYGVSGWCVYPAFEFDVDSIYESEDETPNK